ncbi:hypothetical protein HDV06_004220 [Boothiomyces sp. JEL0866]|nr:hypothetical protein HDV06_004220 [Boothiomyces sp. JEL0866]
MSFVEYDADTDFPITNIPFGIISTYADPTPRPATAIGNFAVDLKALANIGAFKGPLFSKHAVHVFSQETLNDFMALGRPVWREARATIQDLLSKNGSDLLSGNKALQDKVLIPLEQVRNHLPAKIGDYTDFYSSKEHATNVGTMFRGKDNALMPNWVHIPVAYHGRASSVVVSGTPIKRPSGITLDPETKKPGFSVCRKLDIELEVAFFVGVGNKLGEPIPVTEAEDHIFGMVVMNDWSARDIQQFEYVPLGPFLGKNFGTTISPWIVTLDALEEYRVPLPVQDPAPSAYLVDPNSDKDQYDVELDVYWKSSTSEPTLVSKSNLKYMYWSFKQQLAHHSVNGCNMNTGDLLGSGTISGPTEDSFGSFLELTWNGTKPITLQDGSSRTFLLDGDEITLKGTCKGKNRIGFGACSGVVLPANLQK